MLNVLIFFGAFGSLIAGLGFIYKPVWLVRFNKIAREKIFADNLILLERRKKGAFFVLLFFIFLYWGYYRSQYSLRYTDQIISTNRLLYQSLQHLHSRQYAEVKRLCEKVLTREPNNAQALYQMGAVQLLLNDPVAAQRSWSKARALDPNSPNAQSLREWVARLKGSDTPEISLLK